MISSTAPSATGSLELLGASLRLCLASRRLVVDSRDRVDGCRRLIGRKRIICGGSGDDDLRFSVRDRLRSGALPPATWRCWPAPRATGQPCLVCDGDIAEPDIDYIIAGAPPRHAHVECYNVWVAESSKLSALDPRKRVALADPAAIGRILAKVEGGQWVYVSWMRRRGHDGTLTKERSTDLLSADTPTEAVGDPRDHRPGRARA